MPVRFFYAANIMLCLEILEIKILKLYLYWKLFCLKIRREFIDRIYLIKTW